MMSLFENLSTRAEAFTVLLNFLLEFSQYKMKQIRNWIYGLQNSFKSWRKIIAQDAKKSAKLSMN